MIKQLLSSLLLLSCVSFAKDINVGLTYQKLDFENSKKKDKGIRKGFDLDILKDDFLYQLSYEKTDTDTFKPPLKKDLEVDKYYFKITKKLNSLDSFSLSFATINDSIMKEADGGKIYGLGYKHKNISFTQYFSNYKNFDVYQSDFKMAFKKSFDEVSSKFILITKYIKLKSKNSNKFSKNAKSNYLTTGLKIHSTYKTYHFGVGAFFGKRVFAVMKNGFKVQHHAMEFEKTYMCGVGKKFAWGDINLKYIYQKATELPINNKNVKVKNIVSKVTHTF